MGQVRDVEKILVGKCSRKRLLGKPKRRLKVVLMQILEKCAYGVMWTGFICLMVGPSGRLS